MMATRGAGNPERYAPIKPDRRYSGFTLVEMVIVVAILALIFGMSGLAFGSLRAPRASARLMALRQARSMAILGGRPARAVLPSDSAGYRSRFLVPLFLPDGRAVGDGVNLLTGAPLDSAR